MICTLRQYLCNDIKAFIIYLIWGFPEIGLPLNHPFSLWIFLYKPSIYIGLPPFIPRKDLWILWIIQKHSLVHYILRCSITQSFPFNHPAIGVPHDYGHHHFLSHEMNLVGGFNIFNPSEKSESQLGLLFPISGWWFKPSWKIWVRQWEGLSHDYPNILWKIKM